MPLTEKEDVMDDVYIWTAGLLAAALFIYLVAVLLRPEDFS
jgi:K+-transporting ATPase KdpF subunit